MDWLESTKKSLEQRDDKSVIDSDFRTRIVYAEIERKWDRIREEALADLKAISPPFNATQEGSVLQGLISRLEDDVTPNETGTWPNQRPATFEQILNAGWMRKRAIIAAAPDIRGADDDLNNLNRLVLRAIESSQTHRAYAHRLQSR